MTRRRWLALLTAVGLGLGAALALTGAVQARAITDPSVPRQVKITNIVPLYSDYEGYRSYSASVDWQKPKRAGWGGVRPWRWDETDIDADLSAGFQVRPRDDDRGAVTFPHTVQSMPFTHTVAGDGGGLAEGIDPDAGQVMVAEWEVRTWTRVDGVDRYSAWVNAKYPRPVIARSFAGPSSSYHYYRHGYHSIDVSWFVRAGSLATRYSAILTPDGGEPMRQVLKGADLRSARWDDIPRNVSFTIKLRAGQGADWGPAKVIRMTRLPLTNKQVVYDANGDGWLSDAELDQARADYDADPTWDNYDRLMDILAINYSITEG